MGALSHICATDFKLNSINFYNFASPQRSYSPHPFLPVPEGLIHVVAISGR